jgi:IBR domain, a half RING-finger domain
MTLQQTKNFGFVLRQIARSLAFSPRTQVDKSTTAVHVACPLCLISYCQCCSRIWSRGRVAHTGLTCREYAAQLASLSPDSAEEWVERAGAQRCRRCHAAIEKNEGCRHMTCRCGYEFCWTCGQEWTRSHWMVCFPLAPRYNANQISADNENGASVRAGNRLGADAPNGTARASLFFSSDEWLRLRNAPVYGLPFPRDAATDETMVRTGNALPSSNISPPWARGQEWTRGQELTRGHHRPAPGDIRADNEYDERLCTSNRPNPRAPNGTAMTCSVFSPCWSFEPDGTRIHSETVCCRPGLNNSSTDQVTARMGLRDQPEPSATTRSSIFPTFLASDQYIRSVKALPLLDDELYASATTDNVPRP